MNFVPVTPEKTGLICILFYDMANTGIFSKISQDIVDRFLQSFHRMKALWVQMIDLFLIFQFVEDRCHGNQLILGKCHERRLIPLAFFALSFENELQYRCLNVRANSGDDVAISCISLVNFCLVTPEILVWDTTLERGRRTETKHISAFIHVTWAYLPRSWGESGHVVDGDSLHNYTKKTFTLI